MWELSLLAVELCLAQPRVLTPAACWCRYADDPTVMSWNLINEPRCYQCGDAIQVRFSSVLCAGLNVGFRACQLWHATMLHIWGLQRTLLQ